MLKEILERVPLFLIESFDKNINYTFNLWDSLIALVSLGVSVFVAIWIYKLSKQISAKDRYEHEIRITNAINQIGSSSVILADVKKYTPFRTDYSNQTYYKQGAELYTCIPEYGVQVILMPASEKIPVGLIPFSWVEVIRKHDSEDNKPIIVCKFKGVKWYKNFKSPFKEVNYMYVNPDYQEGIDPKFLKFTTLKPEAK